jgi:hypothetical protein
MIYRHILVSMTLPVQHILVSMTLPAHPGIYEFSINHHGSQDISPFISVMNGEIDPAPGFPFADSNGLRLFHTESFPLF